MNKSVPIITQTSLIRQAFPLTVLVILMVGFSRIDESYGFFYGVALYLFYSFGIRKLLTSSHRKGISLMTKEQFPQAIESFQESIEFFLRHPWIDKYRWAVLMSPSTMSYHEMGLTNIAFSYSQMGDGKMARMFYQECLKTYPQNSLAKSSLKMLDAGAAHDT